MFHILHLYLPTPLFPIIMMPFSDATAAHSPPRFSHDLHTTTCSTPFLTAPSTPAPHAPSGYFFSAPASPMHFLQYPKAKTAASPCRFEPFFISSSDSASFEFEFSSRFSPDGIRGNSASMTSADELFFNGRILPMKLASHLESPQEAVTEYTEAKTLRGRNPKAKHSHRKARSMSPLRTNAQHELRGMKTVAANEGNDTKEYSSTETTPSCSASSSRSSSSSSGRNSKKWIFLKDLLNRSKGEGIANGKERFWSAISFSPSPARDKIDDKKNKCEDRKAAKKPPAAGKPANGVWRRRVPPSAHERHYTAKRAQAEEMKRKTFLPYRQGLLGCLGFSSKSYCAFSGFTRNMNPIYSR